MDQKINHWCILCGKGYHACDACNEVRTFAPWRAFTDSIDHFKIFSVLKDYNNRIITKDEAKELLSHVNLGDKDSFKENSRKLIDEIFKKDIAPESKSIKKGAIATSAKTSTLVSKKEDEKKYE